MGILKSRWMSSEDDTLCRVVAEQLAAGGGDEKFVSWVLISSHIPGRTAKQCRERWKGVLDPSLNRTALTLEELAKVDGLIEKHGKAWSIIASEIGNGRSELMIRNMYYARQRKHSRMGEKGAVKLAAQLPRYHGRAPSSVGKHDSDSQDESAEELEEDGSSATKSVSSHEGECADCPDCKTSKTVATTAPMVDCPTSMGMTAPFPMFVPPYAYMGMPYFPPGMMPYGAMYPGMPFPFFGGASPYTAPCSCSQTEDAESVAKRAKHGTEAEQAAQQQPHACFQPAMCGMPMQAWPGMCSTPFMPMQPFVASPPTTGECCSHHSSPSTAEPPAAPKPRATKAPASKGTKSVSGVKRSRLEASVSALLSIGSMEGGVVGGSPRNAELATHA